MSKSKINSKKKPDVKEIQQKIDEIQKSYPVSVSDWLTFLGNKSSTNVNLLAFIGYIAIVVFIYIVDYTTSINLEPLLVIGFVIISYFIFLFVIWHMGNQTKPYQDLSEKIVEGKITNPKQILEEYKQIKAKLKK